MGDRDAPGQGEADIEDVAIHVPEDVGAALVHLAEVAGGTIVIEPGWAPRGRQSIPRPVERARDHLVARFLSHPAVSLIDIGLDPGGRAAVRVHVRPGQPPPTDLPDEMDGVPVILVRGDYHLEG